MPGKRLYILLFLLAAASIAAAQDDVLNSRNIFDIRHVTEAVVAPDGAHTAYILTLPRSFDDEPGGDYRELHVLDMKTGESKAYISGKKSLWALGWTPDSRAITFLAAFEGNKTQVHAIDLDGGEARRVTSSPSPVYSYSFHSSGKRVAYISVETGDPDIEKLKAKGFNQEVYEENQPSRNIYIHDLETGAARKLTSGVSAFSLAWSPDGKYIAAAIAPENLVDHSYMFKRIHLVDPESGALTKWVENPGKLGVMRWSPDSRHLAFISAANINDSKEGSLYVAAVHELKAFEDLHNYSKGFEGTVGDIQWKDAGTLLYSSDEGVDVTLREQSLASGESRVLIPPGKVVFHSFSIGTGDVVFAGNSPRHPGEVYSYSLSGGALQRRSTNNAWLKDIRLAKQVEFRYKAGDGLEITSVLIYPLGYEKGKRYPLITYIHGGPEACNKNGWIASYGNWGQTAASRGYVVFLPNYRASTGRGVEYAYEGFGDLAGREFDDVIDGIDVLVDRGIVDGTRVGIGGGSYGGYFAAWGATRHSERFAASVVFVGVSNQISKRNTTDIPFEDYYVHWGIWTHEDFEKVYDRSPVKWTSNSRTPTLILHGTKDPRVHPSQSLELYRSLKLHGKAPVRLIWYPGEGHGNRKNPARLDFSLRTLRWFDYYLKTGTDKERMPAAAIDYPIDGKPSVPEKLISE